MENYKKIFFLILLLFLVLNETKAQVSPFGGPLLAIDGCNNGNKLLIRKYLLLLPSLTRIIKEETFMFENNKSILLVGSLIPGKQTLGLAYRGGCCKKTRYFPVYDEFGNIIDYRSEEYCEDTDWTIKFIGTSIRKL